MNRHRIFDKVDSIVFQDVRKQYNRSKTLGPCNLTINGGEFLAVVGPSGSGKTTLLRMINQLVLPDTGSLTINGQDIRSFDPIALRRNTGYVIQQIGLFPHLTVAQNIGLVLTLEKMPKNAVQDRVEELLTLVRLEPGEFGERFPRQLSGGQQQRVGLARALAADPPLLLMDEPFGALDPLLRAEVLGEFLHLKQTLQKTIVFVTHDLDEAFRLGDRIAVVHEGQVLRTGIPEDLILDKDMRKIIFYGGAGRYLDYLRVRSFVTPAGALPRLAPFLTAEQALAAMVSQKEPYVLILKNGKPAGVIASRDLIIADARTPVIAIAERCIIVSPDDPVSQTLAVLKESGQEYALVKDKETVVGIFSVRNVLGITEGRDRR